LIQNSENNLISQYFNIIYNKPYHFKKSGLDSKICWIFLHNVSGLLEGCQQ